MSSVVGRDAEIAAAEEFLAAPDGGAAVLAIVGEPGIGKTTLWEQAVALARGRGAHVLAARPAEAEAKLSFAGLADLLATVPSELLATLPPPQRAALEVALLRAESTRPPERRVLGTAFASLVREVAAAGEVVVAVDDVQWLDGPSAAVAAFALRRLDDVRARVLVSLRPDAGSPLLGAVADARLERLVLGPLSVAALHRVIAERLGRTLRRPVLVRVAEASGGSPFYALEIARLLGGGPQSPLPVPADVIALVRERIRSLPPASRAALLLAATAARPDVHVVDTGALAAAEEAELVEVAADGRISFTHPLYASAVYSSVPLARRRDAHRALATSVRDPEERARHLALGASAPDEQAAATVTEAAALAHARGAPDAAAELTELALQLTPADAEPAAGRRLALAGYLELAGDLARARAEVDELLAAPLPDDLRARALLLRAGLVYRHEGESAAAAVAREAVAAAREPIVRARCLAALAGWAGTVDAEAAAAAAQAAVETLEAEGGEPELLAFALGSLVRAELLVGNGYDARAAQRALELEQASPPPTVDDRIVYRLGQWLRYADDFDGARARLEEAERAAEDEGDESSFLNILLNRVVLELWAGRWDDAAALAARLAATGAALGLPDAARVWEAYLDAHRGDLEAVQRAAAAADRSEPIVDMLHLRALGLAELGAECYEDAHRHLAAAVELIERVGTHEPAIWRVHGDAVEAAVAAGELDAADRLTTGFERHAAHSAIPWNRAVSFRSRGLVLAARGDLDAAAAALERSLVAHERCPAPFERARTLLALGRVRRRLKQKRLGREALEEAFAVFEQLGSAAWAERTREELRRVTTRRAPETLTPTEQEIARLAAAGLTNQAIADRVFVSRKTVEANLARVYRKLGISSRAQLARALEPQPPAVTS